MFSSALQGELLTHFERWCLSQSSWSLDRQDKVCGVIKQGQRGNLPRVIALKLRLALLMSHSLSFATQFRCSLIPSHGKKLDEKKMLEACTWYLFTGIVNLESTILRVLCSKKTGWQSLIPFSFLLFFHQEMIVYLHRTRDSFWRWSR